jgi:hypothetical protein
MSFSWHALCSIKITKIDERANPFKGGVAKPRVYSRKAMIAGLPKSPLNDAFG